MVFSSITFLAFFLPLTLLIYYSCPILKYRNLLLLFLSLLFYAWGEPIYVLVMIASIIVNHALGLFVGNRSLSILKRRFFLVVAIILNIGVLFVFKYLGFALTSINSLLQVFNLSEIGVVHLLMPIGISFYTFQALSYVIDVYRKPELVQKNIFHTGLYITLFPQLIAGPIVRYHDINEQITARSHSVSLFVKGAERFIIGLSKKVLIANVMGKVVDGIYSLGFESYNTYYSWVAVLAYSLQIYYDFSGYSDMAIGLGKMFGFNLLENFNFPYAATSIRDFWRRWHISLSSWFKDYLYIPLGGNRKGEVRTFVNLYIVFFITGLWHGAATNFILWGLGHGTLMLVERTVSRVVKTQRTRVLDIVLRIYTLLSVSLLWVLFRNDTKDSVKIILKMMGVNYTSFMKNYMGINNGQSLFVLVDSRFYVTFLIGILLCFPWWRKFSPITTRMPASLLFTLKFGALLLLCLLSYASLANSSYNPFIYFRF